jgi:hypothetical protein
MEKRGPKYLKTQREDTPHVGQLLVTYYKKKKIFQAPLARDMNRTVATMVSYKKNSSMQTAILWELCHVLRYNFFADLAAELPVTFPNKNSATPTDKDEEITRLKARVERLEGDKELLMELMKK